MTISTRDELYDAMINRPSRLVIDKASLSNAAANQRHSLWRATGQPGQGAIPTAAAVCDMASPGALQFDVAGAGENSVLGILEASCTNATTSLEMHDRLMHMGGLVGNVTTAQTVALDLSASLGTSNLAERVGADYGDVMWWLEWYTDTGATVSVATVNVTYDDGTTGNLNTVSLAATRRATFMQPLNSLIPAGVDKRIRGVNTVQLSASTGTAGNFGVTASRYRAGQFLPVAFHLFTQDAAQLGLPVIFNDSCLFCIQTAGTTTTGNVRAQGKIGRG